MKKHQFLFLLSSFIIPTLVIAQNLGPDEELYLRDPHPRYHGEQVEMLQRFLLFQGIDIGPDGIDGWFGVDTDNALRAYQESEDLPVTGRIPIRDISGPLEWDPFVESELFTGGSEGSFTGKTIDYQTFRLTTENDFHHSGYFGAITIESDEIESNSYRSFLLSPHERFLAALNEDRTMITLWDILSGIRIQYNIEETAKIKHYEGLNQENIEEYSHFLVEEIYWGLNNIMVGMGQYALAVSYTYERGSTTGRSRLDIYPYTKKLY